LGQFFDTSFMKNLLQCWTAKIDNFASTGT
jgi:hypothetical protein